MPSRKSAFVGKKAKPLARDAADGFAILTGQTIGQRKLLARDEVRRIAANIAKLPGLHAERNAGQF